MARPLYEIVNGWMQNDWDILQNYDIINPINSQLVEMGHGESSIGKSLKILLDWLDDMVAGYGIIMTDEEMRDDLRKMLQDNRLVGLKEIIVEVHVSPNLKVTILNLDELRKTADPGAATRAKSEIDDFLAGFGYGDKR
ncbi:MAG: hypothetical protein P1Q69_14465 [Candidatus Thorarchaeota archaeon]|nr:hypothetical protein [Candidatus Thorarchaeota archaeon]